MLLDLFVDNIVVFSCFCRIVFVMLGLFVRHERLQRYSARSLTLTLQIAKSSSSMQLLAPAPDPVQAIFGSIPGKERAGNEEENRRLATAGAILWSARRNYFYIEICADISLLTLRCSLQPRFSLRDVRFQFRSFSRLSLQRFDVDGEFSKNL